MPADSRWDLIRRLKGEYTETSTSIRCIHIRIRLRLTV